MVLCSVVAEPRTRTVLAYVSSTTTSAQNTCGWGLSEKKIAPARRNTSRHKSEKIVSTAMGLLAEDVRAPGTGGCNTPVHHPEVPSVAGNAKSTCGA